MLLLDSHNLLIQTILTEKFSAKSPSGVDQVITDFDNVTFHLSNPQGPDEKPIKTIIHLSMAIKCYRDLVKYGATDVLKREYNEMIINPEQGYDFTIEINLEKLPPSQGFSFPHFNCADVCRRTRQTHQKNLLDQTKRPSSTLRRCFCSSLHPLQISSSIPRRIPRCTPTSKHRSSSNPLS